MLIYWQRVCDFKPLIYCTRISVFIGITKCLGKCITLGNIIIKLAGCQNENGSFTQTVLEFKKVVVLTITPRIYRILLVRNSTFERPEPTEFWRETQYIF